MPLRRPHGNMLVLISACTIGLLAALAFFGLGYVRLIGTNNEQRTAIEAASMAAARDLSLIAINTNTYGGGSTCPYGLVSLSDYAPNGSNTNAQDLWDTPVRGMNTILGTIRLDLIIADQIGDANLIYMINQDMTTALAAQTILSTALQDAILSSPANGPYKDINGNTINVYTDAQTAYTANNIRMTGSSNYVTGSLALSLGYVQNGSATNIPTPTNATNPQLAAGTTANNCYVSYVDVPYTTTTAPATTTHFVFSGIGTNVKLMDPKVWTATPTGMPGGYTPMPTIVKAQADQQMTAAHNTGGNGGDGYTVHAVSCAQPANVVDPRPAPGSLSFSFPDGIPPEMTQPADMLHNVTADNPTDARMLNGTSSQAVATFGYSSGGDTPMTTNTAAPQIVDYASWPYPTATIPQTTGNVFRQALYDWWKRAGTRLDVGSAATMMTYSTTSPCLFVAATPAIVPWNSHVAMSDPNTYTLTTLATQAGPTSPAGQFPGIPNGSLQLYRVDPITNQVSFTHTIISPIPYAVAGENQLYSENLGAIFNSSVPTFVVGPFSAGSARTNVSNTFMFTAMYDCYIRDQVYRPNDTFHQGEPLDCPVVALAQPTTEELGAGGIGGDDHGPGPGPWPGPGPGPGGFTGGYGGDYNTDWSVFYNLNNWSQWGNQWQVNMGGAAATKNTTVGTGQQPILTTQADFGYNLFNGNSPAYYYIYSTGSGTPAIRPTYQTNGMAVDVRFRRQVDPDQTTSTAVGFSTGYVGDKYVTATGGNIGATLDKPIGTVETFIMPNGTPSGPQIPSISTH